MANVALVPDPHAWIAEQASWCVETNPEQQEQEAFEFDVDAAGADGLVSGVQGQELQLKSNDQGQVHRYKDTKHDQSLASQVDLGPNWEIADALVREVRALLSNTASTVIGGPPSP